MIDQPDADATWHQLPWYHRWPLAAFGYNTPDGRAFIAELQLTMDEHRAAADPPRKEPHA